MAFERDIWGDHADAERSTVTSRFLRDFRKIPSAATPSIVLASFISNVTAMALPFAVLIVYDRVVPNAAEHTLYHLPLIRTHVPNPGFRWTLWSTVPG